MSRGQPSGQTKESFTAGHPVPAVNETATVSKTPAENTASRFPAHPNGAWCHANRSPGCHWLRGDIGYCVYAVQGPLRAELVREPVSRGWGNSYAVRLLNSAGQPMEVSGIWLAANMADGSVEQIAMAALPEPGMYRRKLAPVPLHSDQCSSPSEHGRQIR
jgi:hypothetical protein